MIKLDLDEKYKIINLKSVSNMSSYCERVYNVGHDES